MFSSKKQPSELERLVKRATDETLTSDNWQYILEVCDKISLDPEEGTEEAINLISQRLLSKDANIVLRSLSLLVAMAENCGSRMRQRIASKTFVNDVLLKRLSDKKLHRTLKIRIAEVIEQLHQSFKDDPSLKPMTYGFQEVSKNYPQYLSQGKAGAVPNIPAKEEISQADKIREEEELQRVLKLSLNEYERESTLKKTATVDKPLPEVKNATSNSVSNKEQKDDNTKNIANVSRVRALYDLISYEPDELSFRKGDTITVIESVYRDWWRGALPNGKIGIFPLNYVTPIVSKSDSELNQEWQEEEELLTGHSRKIDYLLALLSSNSESANEDEITSLYNEIIPLRPSLGKAIDKYSVRKEELAILNHQLNAESRLYNELADKSISSRVNRNSSNPYAPPYPTDVGGANYRSNKGQFPSQHRTGGTGGPPAPGIPNFDNTSAPSYTNYDYSSRPPYYTNESGVIREQNTSTGFGNDNIIGNYPQASQPIYGRNDPGYPGYIGSRSNSYVSSDHYSNVNKFPDVNDL